MLVLIWVQIVCKSYLSHAGYFFMLMLSSADFFKKQFILVHYESVKQFRPTFVGPNCLQMLSAEDKSRH